MSPSKTGDSTHAHKWTSHWHACCSLFVAAGAAHAADTTITNNCGLPIDELAVSAPGANQWGDNLLKGVAEGALDSGKALAVAGLADGTYDFQLSASDEGVMCVIANVTVAGGAVELTPDLGKTCK